MIANVLKLCYNVLGIFNFLSLQLQTALHSDANPYNILQSLAASEYKRPTHQRRSTRTMEIEKQTHNHTVTVQ